MPSWKTETETTLHGLERLQPLLQTLGIEATFFVMSTWARAFPHKIVELSTRHEIASHAWSHSLFHDQDYLNSKLALEDIIGKSVHGFRMPRLAKCDYSKLRQAGYSYDASLNPTWIPGRYNNRHAPITPFLKDGLDILPSSVTPVLRIPLFWLSFKNFPNFFNHLLAKRIMKNRVILFYIHPCEFADIGDTGLPYYIRNIYGTKLIEKLKVFLEKLRPNVDFITCNEHAELFLRNSSTKINSPELNFLLFKVD